MESDITTTAKYYYYFFYYYYYYYYCYNKYCYTSTATTTITAYHSGRLQWQLCTSAATTTITANEQRLSDTLGRAKGALRQLQLKSIFQKS